MCNFTNFASDNFASLVWIEAYDREFFHGYKSQAHVELDANREPRLAVATLTSAEYTELARKS